MSQKTYTSKGIFYTSWLCIVLWVEFLLQYKLTCSLSRIMGSATCYFHPEEKALCRTEPLEEQLHALRHAKFHVPVRDGSQMWTNCPKRGYHCQLCNREELHEITQPAKREGTVISAAGQWHTLTILIHSALGQRHIYTHNLLMNAARVVVWMCVCVSV